MRAEGLHPRYVARLGGPLEEYPPWAGEGPRPRTRREADRAYLASRGHGPPIGEMRDGKPFYYTKVGEGDFKKLQAGQEDSEAL